MPITRDIGAPLFVVIGSTGLQGTSVIRSLQASSKPYRVRAITREISSANAQERAAWGCELMAADIDNVDSVSRAFSGAVFVFGMTLPGYGPGVSDPEGKEYKRGRNQIDAAVAAGVTTFVWAGLPSTSKLSSGKYPAAHFDAKAKVADYARSLSSSSFKLIEVQPALYFSMLYTGMAPMKQPGGVFIVPAVMDKEEPVPLLDAEPDFGKFVVGAVEHGGVDVVLAASVYTTTEERLALFTELSGGQTIVRVKVPEKDVKKSMVPVLGEVGANNFLNVMYALGAAGYYGGADIEPSKAVLSSPVRTLEDSVHAHKEEFEKLFGQPPVSFVGKVGQGIVKRFILTYLKIAYN